jgi:hypothetical protein
MKILNEKKETVYKMDFEISKEEERLLLDHYKKNCPKKDKKNFKMEWSVIDLMKKFIAENK